MKFSIKKYFKKAAVAANTTINNSSNNKSKKKKNRNSTATNATATSESDITSTSNSCHVSNNTLSSSISKESVNQKLHESSILDSRSLLQIQLPNDFSRPFDVPELHGDYINERISVMSTNTTTTTTTTTVSMPMTSTSSRISSASFFDAVDDLSSDAYNNDDYHNKPPYVTVSELEVGKTKEVVIASVLSITKKSCEEQNNDAGIITEPAPLRDQLKGKEATAAEGENTASPISSNCSSSTNITDMINSAVVNDDASLSQLLRETSAPWINESNSSFMLDNDEESAQFESEELQEEHASAVQQMPEMGSQEPLHNEKSSAVHIESDERNEDTSVAETLAAGIKTGLESITLETATNNDATLALKEEDASSLFHQQKNVKFIDIKAACYDNQKKPMPSFIPRKLPHKVSKESAASFANASQSEYIGRSKIHHSFIPVSVISTTIKNGRRHSTDTIDKTGNSSVSTATATTSYSTKTTAGLSSSSSSSISPSSSCSLSTKSSNTKVHSRLPSANRKRPVSNTSLIPKYNYSSNPRQQHPQEVTVTISSCSSASGNSRIPKRRVSVGLI